MPRKRRKAKVDGEHILYHYLQKDLRQTDIWLFQMLSARLMSELGIWLHPQIYQELPFLIPFALRDPSCRKRFVGDEEQWGTPNDLGYFRDDNTLIKELPKSLEIVSPQRAIYNRKLIGKGFTAAHVWRTLTGSDTETNNATRNPVTYSFVPNLVWLPRQVAKLSDREGSFSQSYLQALAVKIYRSLPVNRSLEPLVEKAWAMLEIPEGIPEQGLPEVDDLNYFDPDPDFLNAQRKKIKVVATALERVSNGDEIVGRVVSERYTNGIVNVASGQAKRLAKELNTYFAASKSAAKSKPKTQQMKSKR